MKAITYTRFGGPEVLTLNDAVKPEISADEVLVKVAATSFNPYDAVVRSGGIQKFIQIRFPYIPGADISGIVEKIGGGVRNLKEGISVFGMQEVTKNGASAEYVAVKSASVTYAPKSIPLQDAATLPVAGITAWQGLFDNIKLQPGQRVLITAASGGVGSMAVQLAKWKGAYVIGTASERNFGLLKSLGADEVIDHNNNSWTDVIKSKLDSVFNLARLNAEQTDSLMHLLKRGGSFISATSPVDEKKAKELEVKAKQMVGRADAKTLSYIADLIDAGKLKTVIRKAVTLAQLPKVHEEYASGLISGKVKVVVNDSL
jgi:NADPH:quinone reductase-like Zn-dependent oxidoreductase